MSGCALQNPIFNPGIVKDIPTPRQDAILQHLSDIRKVSEVLSAQSRAVEGSSSSTRSCLFTVVSFFFASFQNLLLKQREIETSLSLEANA